MLIDDVPVKNEEKGCGSVENQVNNLHWSGLLGKFTYFTLIRVYSCKKVSLDINPVNCLTGGTLADNIIKFAEIV